VNGVGGKQTQRLRAGQSIPCRNRSYSGRQGIGDGIITSHIWLAETASTDSSSKKTQATVGRRRNYVETQ
jgi:hypothetical protein